MSTLVIRGGAIGDFVLTLPAIRLLRMAFPEAPVDILGCYPAIQLAEGRFYARATRSLDSASLSGLFVPRAQLSKALREYLAGFQIVINYIYDPCFSENLLRIGVQCLIQGSSKIDGDTHAAYQLARPLEKLSLFLQNPAAQIFLSNQDQQNALYVLKNMGCGAPFFVMHPGSGGADKNWPLACWKKLFLWVLQKFPCYNLVCVGGEADKLALKYFSLQICSPRLYYLDGLPLPTLAGVLSQACAFVGQDSGVSHIAAATGIHCLLLYGSTNPSVWAPANILVSIVSHTTSMQDLPFEVVQCTFQSLVQRIG
ncbi:MAG: glycosyltransferase family 9 protein [Candidatus Xiphinematobacter sp.]|nr:MAG: glycosyltransferase family 9 protein [Candidatus Xiphinematobacter sp.]